MPGRREIQIDKLRRFREQAEIYRLRAATMKQEHLSHTNLIRIAESYERMAIAIQVWLDALPPQSN
jgi:hypothetical protein